LSFSYFTVLRNRLSARYVRRSASSICPMRCWISFTKSSSYCAVQCVLPPSIPKNEGFFDQIHLVVPPGCVLNPAPGKPVSAGTHHPGADVGEVIAVALQHVLPDKAVPQTYKTGIPTIIVGIDPVTGQSFTDHSAEVYAGWCNAAKGMDAWGCQAASFGNLWKATAEINESLFPHIQWSRDYRTDSGGPGQWRGICGSHYEKEVLVDAKVYTYVVGMKYPMPGICGGSNGAPNEMILRYGSDDEYRVGHTADWIPLFPSVSSDGSSSDLRLFASLVRLMYGVMATAFIAAFLGVIVLYVYVKVLVPKPAGNFEVPRAKIN